MGSIKRKSQEKYESVKKVRSNSSTPVIDATETNTDLHSEALTRRFAVVIEKLLPYQENLVEMNSLDLKQNHVDLPIKNTENSQCRINNGDTEKTNQKDKTSKRKTSVHSNRNSVDKKVCLESCENTNEHFNNSEQIDTSPQNPEGEITKEEDKIKKTKNECKMENEKKDDKRNKEFKIEKINKGHYSRNKKKVDDESVNKKQFHKNSEFKTNKEYKVQKNNLNVKQNDASLPIKDREITQDRTKDVERKKCKRTNKDREVENTKEEDKSHMKKASAYLDGVENKMLSPKNSEYENKVYKGQNNGSKQNYACLSDKDKKNRSNKTINVEKTKKVKHDKINEKINIEKAKKYDNKYTKGDKSKKKQSTHSDGKSVNKKIPPANSDYKNIKNNKEQNINLSSEQNDVNKINKEFKVEKTKKEGNGVNANEGKSRKRKSSTHLDGEFLKKKTFQNSEGKNNKMQNNSLDHKQKDVCLATKAKKNTENKTKDKDKKIKKDKCDETNEKFQDEKAKKSYHSENSQESKSYKIEKSVHLDVQSVWNDNSDENSEYNNNHLENYKKMRVLPQNHLQAIKNDENGIFTPPSFNSESAINRSTDKEISCIPFENLSDLKDKMKTSQKIPPVIPTQHQTTERKLSTSDLNSHRQHRLYALSKDDQVGNFTSERLNTQCTETSNTQFKDLKSSNCVNASIEVIDLRDSPIKQKNEQNIVKEKFTPVLDVSSKSQLHMSSKNYQVEHFTEMIHTTKFTRSSTKKNIYSDFKDLSHLIKLNTSKIKVGIENCPIKSANESNNERNILLLTPVFDISSQNQSPALSKNYKVGNLASEEIKSQSVTDRTVGKEAFYTSSIDLTNSKKINTSKENVNIKGCSDKTTNVHSTNSISENITYSKTSHFSDEAAGSIKKVHEVQPYFSSHSDIRDIYDVIKKDGVIYFNSLSISLSNGDAETEFSTIQSPTISSSAHETEISNTDAQEFSKSVPAQSKGCLDFTKSKNLDKMIQSISEKVSKLNNAGESNATTKKIKIKVPQTKGCKSTCLNKPATVFKENVHNLSSNAEIIDIIDGNQITNFIPNIPEKVSQSDNASASNELVPTCKGNKEVQKKIPKKKGVCEPLSSIDLKTNSDVQKLAIDVPVVNFIGGNHVNGSIPKLREKVLQFINASVSNELVLNHESRKNKEVPAKILKNHTSELATDVHTNRTNEFVPKLQKKVSYFDVRNTSLDGRESDKKKDVQSRISKTHHVTSSVTGVLKENTDVQELLSPVQKLSSHIQVDFKEDKRLNKLTPKLQEKVSPHYNTEIIIDESVACDKSIMIKDVQPKNLERHHWSALATDVLKEDVGAHELLNEKEPPSNVQVVESKDDNYKNKLILKSEEKVSNLNTENIISRTGTYWSALATDVIKENADVHELLNEKEPPSDAQIVEFKHDTYTNKSIPKSQETLNTGHGSDVNKGIQLKIPEMCCLRSPSTDVSKGNTGVQEFSIDIPVIDLTEDDDNDAPHEVSYFDIKSGEKKKNAEFNESHCLKACATNSNTISLQKKMDSALLSKSNPIQPNVFKTLTNGAHELLNEKEPPSNVQVVEPKDDNYKNKLIIKSEEKVSNLSTESIISLAGTYWSALATDVIKENADVHELLNEKEPPSDSQIVESKHDTYTNKSIPKSQILNTGHRSNVNKGIQLKIPEMSCLRSPSTDVSNGNTGVQEFSIDIPVIDLTDDDDNDALQEVSYFDIKSGEKNKNAEFNESHCLKACATNSNTISLPKKMNSALLSKSDSIQPNVLKILTNDSPLIDRTSNVGVSEVNKFIDRKKYTDEYFQYNFPPSVRSYSCRAKDKNKVYFRSRTSVPNLSIDEVECHLKSSDIKNLCRNESSNIIKLEVYSLSRKEIECYHRMLDNPPSLKQIDTFFKAADRKGNNISSRKFNLFHKFKRRRKEPKTCSEKDIIRVKDECILMDSHFQNSSCDRTCPSANSISSCNSYISDFKFIDDSEKKDLSEMDNVRKNELNLFANTGLNTSSVLLSTKLDLKNSSKYDLSGIDLSSNAERLLGNSSDANETLCSQNLLNYLNLPSKEIHDNLTTKMNSLNIEAYNKRELNSSFEFGNESDFNRELHLSNSHKSAKPTQLSENMNLEQHSYKESNTINCSNSSFFNIIDMPATELRKILETVGSLCNTNNISNTSEKSEAEYKNISNYKFQNNPDVYNKDLPLTNIEYDSVSNASKVPGLKLSQNFTLPNKTILENIVKKYGQNSLQKGETVEDPDRPTRQLGHEQQGETVVRTEPNCFSKIENLSSNPPKSAECVPKLHDVNVNKKSNIAKTNDSSQNEAKSPFNMTAVNIAEFSKLLERSESLFRRVVPESKATLENKEKKTVRFTDVNSEENNKDFRKPDKNSITPANTDIQDEDLGFSLDSTNIIENYNSDDEYVEFSRINNESDDDHSGNSYLKKKVDERPKEKADERPHSEEEETIAVPEYKSKWEKIIERKFMDTKEKEKVNEYLLKDCIPASTNVKAQSKKQNVYEAVPKSCLKYFENDSFITQSNTQNAVYKMVPRSILKKPENKVSRNTKGTKKM